jgi:hypothetical protein
MLKQHAILIAGTEPHEDPRRPERPAMAMLAAPEFNDVRCPLCHYVFHQLPDGRFACECEGHGQKKASP